MRMWETQLLTDRCGQVTGNRDSGRQMGVHRFQPPGKRKLNSAPSKRTRNVVQDGVKRTGIHSVLRECKLMEPLWRVLNTLERELGNKQSYATECIPEGRTLSQHHRDTCGPTFTTARKWNQPGCPTTSKLIKDSSYTPWNFT